MGEAGGARTRIKICGLTSAEGVDAAVSAGADFIGVVLAESKRRVTVELARSLMERLPGGVWSVAVHRNPAEDLVRAALSGLAVDHHQSDHDDFCGALRIVPASARVPVVRMDECFERAFESVAGGSVTDGTVPAMILVEGAASGAGQTIDWARVREAMRIAPGVRIMLAGGLTPDNVGDAIAMVRPFAVDVSSGVESSPGEKDPELIHRFVRSVRRTDGPHG